MVQQQSLSFLTRMKKIHYPLRVTYVARSSAAVVAVKSACCSAGVTRSRSRFSSVSGRSLALRELVGEVDPDLLPSRRGPSAAIRSDGATRGGDSVFILTVQRSYGNKRWI